MEPNTSPIERAFQLAQSGCCMTIADIQRQLNVEGYVTRQLSGPVLLRQLRGIMEVANERQRHARSGT